MDPKELIAALGVLADPNASDEDKAAALDKLSAYFNSLLDSAGTETPATASEAGDESGKEKESASEIGEKDEERSKEMASALAQIKALTDRIAKMEKASALGSAPRQKAPTVIPRVEPPAQKDNVVSMIEAAE